MDQFERARQAFRHYQARYEVAPYVVVLDIRKPGAAPVDRRVGAGFDVDIYGHGFDHGAAHSFEDGELQTTLQDLCEACRLAAEDATEYAVVEIIPEPETLVVNVKSQFEPEALVRIRITHTRGLDQPAGDPEERALAAVTRGLESLGVRRSELVGA